jgi:hypothetical protein
MHCTARNNTIISYLAEEEQQRRRQSSWERLHLVETSCLRNWLSAERVVVDWAFLPTCELACFLPEQDDSVLYVCCAGSPICVFSMRPKTTVRSGGCGWSRLTVPDLGLLTC